MRTDKPGNENNAPGRGMPFERVRRITGYLVGALDRFNDAKRAEERQRVKHGVNHDVNHAWRQDAPEREAINPDLKDAENGQTR